MAAKCLTDDLSDELTCFICLEYYEHPVILECGHNFCQACLTQCWDETGKTPSCPQCKAIVPKQNLRLNRQLANIIRLVRIHREKGKAEEKRAMCSRHWRSLKFFCRDDLVPVCSACVRSSKHWKHTMVPIEEAFLEHREKFLIQLRCLKHERENLLEKKRAEEQRSQKCLTQLEAERRRSNFAFLQIQKLIKEKNGLWLAQLDALEREIQKRQQENGMRLSEEISHLSHLITEMEVKCQQSACEFLQDLKNPLNRYESQWIELSLGQEEALKMCSQKNSAIESAVRNCAGLMKEALSQESPKSALHKVHVPLKPGRAQSVFMWSEEVWNMTLRRKEQKLFYNAEAFKEFGRAKDCVAIGGENEHGSMGNEESLQTKKPIDCFLQRGAELRRIQGSVSPIFGSFHP